MAYCTKCGNEINDGVAFCSKCGAKQENKAEQTRPTVQNRGQNNKKKAGVGKLSIIVLLIAALLVIGITSLHNKNRVDVNDNIEELSEDSGTVKKAIFGKTKINLSDYTRFEYKGYDTIGKAKAKIDTYGLKDAFSRIAIGDDYEDIDDEDTEDAIDTIVDKMEVVLSIAEDLSNGDSIDVSVIVSEEHEKWLKDHNIELKKAWTEKVEGLDTSYTVVEEFPFDQIYLDDTYTAPFLKVYVKDANEYEPKYGRTLELTVYKKGEEKTENFHSVVENVAMGDTLVITINNAKEILEKGGFLLKETESEIVITEDMFPYHITKESQLTEEVMDQMLDIILTNPSGGAVGRYFHQIEYEEGEYSIVGGYIIYTDRKEMRNPYALMCAITSCDITSKDGSVDWGTQTVYAPIMLRELTVKKDENNELKLVGYPDRLYDILDSTEEKGAFTYIANGEQITIPGLMTDISYIKEVIYRTYDNDCEIIPFGIAKQEVEDN